MTETRFWGIVVLAVLLCIPIGLLIPTIPNSVGSYVLFLTLVAVLLYTRETHKLRILSKKQIELSQEQMELSLKPHLEIIFQRALFRLHNIGNGPAINIRIDDARVSVQQLPEVLMRFACPPIIKKDECLPIEIKLLWAANEYTSDMSPGMYTPPFGTETIDIRVHFKNLIGKEYVHYLIIGKGMPISSDPVDFLLQYLYEKHPKSVHANEIPNLYVKSEELAKHLQYCFDKGLAKADPHPDYEGVEESRNLRITAEGIDYLKGRS